MKKTKLLPRDILLCVLGVTLFFVLTVSIQGCEAQEKKVEGQVSQGQSEHVGNWYGKTSQGHEISFRVETIDGVVNVTEVKYKIKCTGGSFSSTFLTMQPVTVKIKIIDSKFEHSGDFDFSGTFVKKKLVEGHLKKVIVHPQGYGKAVGYVNYSAGKEGAVAAQKVLSVEEADYSHIEASAKEIKRDGRFIAYDNGTVKDTKTGLMWASKDNGEDMNWAAAKRYCENYRGGGYPDWRMPTQEELEGLWDSSESYRATQAAFSVHLTKLIELSSCCPWASETDGGSKAIAVTFLRFGTGSWYDQSFSGRYRALPLRSGK